jgi:hypothetical protein
LHAREIEPELVRQTLNVLLKFQDDIDTAEAELHALIAKARKAG